MKSKKAIAGMLAFTMVLTSIATYQFDNGEESSNADAAYNAKTTEDTVSNLASAVNTMVKDTSADLGTSENPFTVLEVVPYKGMGILGYMVSGQEPVDISKLGYTGEESLLSSLASTGNDSILTYDSQLKTKTMLDPESDNEDEWTFVPGETKTGYYKKQSAAGKGDYTMTIELSDVNYVPVNAFENGFGMILASSVTDSFAVSTGFTDATSDEIKNNVFYKDILFTKSGKSNYTVNEDRIGAQEVIFEYNENPDSGAVTYDAYAVAALDSYYEGKQNDSANPVTAESQFSYEPSYAYVEPADADSDGYYVYDPTASSRYYVYFVRNEEGTGKYTVKSVLDVSTDNTALSGCINVPDCYLYLAKSDYDDLMNDSDNYSVGVSYSKDLYYDDDDNITEIASGNYEVSFVYDTKTTGVKRYSPVTSTAITEFFTNLEQNNTDSTVSYAPTYYKLSNRYYELPVNYRTPDSEITGEYVLFVEDDDGDYIVNTSVDRSDEANAATEDNPVYMANMYQTSLSVKTAASGKYKAKVINATFVYDTSKGLYDWVDLPKSSWPAGTVEGDYLADEIYFANLSMSCYAQGGYVNNNWFATKILGLSEAEAEKYKIKVITVTPDEINSNADYIAQADLVYIQDYDGQQSTIDRMYLWEEQNSSSSYNKNLTKMGSSKTELKDSTVESKHLNFYENDLTWDVTYELFKRAAGLENNYVPVVIDSNIYTETLKGDEGRYYYETTGSNAKIKEVTPKYNPYSGGSSKYYGGNCNIFKLYVMLFSREDPLEFYNEYMVGTVDGYVIYFDASVKGWSNAYIYAWNPSNPSAFNTSSYYGNFPQMSVEGSNLFKFTLPSSAYSDTGSGLAVIIQQSAGNWEYTTRQVTLSEPGVYTITLQSGTITEDTHQRYMASYTSGSTVVDGSVKDGAYSALSGDAAKFWNELTFLPSNSTDRTTLTELNVNSYLVDIFAGRREKDRYEKWPKVSVHKNIFSFDSTQVDYKYNKLTTDLPKANSSSEYLKEAKDGFLELTGKSSLGSGRSEPSWVEVMYYIIRYNMERKFDVEINNKSILRVLEIEPCKDFSLTESEVRSWLPTFTGSIEVTQWISTEYIGHIDDVNERFDIIYIGTNSSKLNLTGFKDTSLDNKYYVHLGDLVTSGKCNTLGMKNQYWLNYDVMTTVGSTTYHYKVSNYENDSKYSQTGAVWFRYSGNDITKLKYDDLINYVKSEFAVILADDIYNRNTSRLDTSSYIYQFAKNTVGTYENVFKESDIRSASSALKQKFQQYAGVTKLALDISTSDEYIVNSTSCDISEGKNVYETTTLKYNYSIIDKDATSSDTYNVTLYADINGDGTYADSEAIAVDTGRKASQYAGGIYTIERNLTSDFVGVLHWALIVEKQDSLKHTDTVEGYMIIKNPSAEKQVIRVLQISSAKRDTSKAANGLHMETQGGSYSNFSAYYNDPEVSDYYTICCARVTTVEFASWYDPGKSSTYKYFDESGNYYTKTISSGVQYDSSDPSTDLLQEYDMIVYGFADSVTDISNVYGAFDNIMDFVAEGKALLTSHDTTSMYNFSGRTGVGFSGDGISITQYGYAGVQNADYMTGLTSTQYIRQIAGMNRFGIPTLYTLSNGINPDETPHDTAFVPNTDQTQYYKTTLTTLSDGTIIGSPINVGYTDYMLEFGSRYTGGGIDSSAQSISGKPMYKVTSRNWSSTNTTNIATRVNEGQITKFPFTIDETFKTSNTHGQYYQLNLDDENLVVWYCLGGSTGTYYEVSRNDARNLYYLYSYNNVFYTGVGHDAYSSTDMEKKLFVNTMIAAYRASTIAPVLNVLNAESTYVDSSSGATTSILYYYTATGTSEDYADASLDGVYVDVLIQPVDFNLINDIMGITFSHESANITSTLKVYMVNSDGSISSTAQGSNATLGGTQVRSSYKYVVRFPMSLLSTTSNGMYTFTAKLTNALGKSYTQDILISKRTLFMLK